MYKCSVKLTGGGSNPSKSSYIAWKDTKKSKWRVSLSYFPPDYQYQNEKQDSANQRFFREAVKNYLAERGGTPPPP